MDNVKAKQSVKIAGILALVSFALTLGVTLISISQGSMMGFSAWNLLDVVLIFVLAIGILLENRACATIFFIYFIASKILMMVQGGIGGAGMGVSLVFAYYYYKGMMGTYVLYKFKEEERIQEMREKIRNRNSSTEQKSYISG